MSSSEAGFARQLAKQVVSQIARQTVDSALGAASMCTVQVEATTIHAWYSKMAETNARKTYSSIAARSCK